jgi:hypothetical protein
VDLRSQLESVLLAHREQFGRWLMEETPQIEMLAQNPRSVSSARERKLRLRDWWHAYERFRIEVFAERPDLREAIIRYLMPM